MKTCTKCGESKPLSEFNKNSRTRDGLRSWCRACVSIASAKWYVENTEKANAARAKWQAANPEKHKASAGKWRAANPGKHRVAVANWAAKNPEKKKAIFAKWYFANPEASRIHSHNRRARASGGKLSPGLAEKLFKLQRGKCACGCKQPLGDNYHLDHRMPLSLGGANEDWNMQLLRSTCNQQKHAKHPVDFMQQKGFLL